MDQVDQYQDQTVIYFPIVEVKTTIVKNRGVGVEVQLGANPK